MAAALTLVWLEREPPSVEARSALEEWARARGVQLEAPRDVPPPELPVDLTVADKVEDDLEHAHNALAALDADGAERALAHAEGSLLEHPELPQAAWLLAEVSRAWAVRWTRVAPVDAERAARAWRQAAALDGGRASGVGEPTGIAPEPAVDATLTLDDAEGTRALLDGVAVSPGALHTAAGRHQLVVSRAGVPVWAAWVNVAPGIEIRAAIPPVAACSKADVAGAKIADDGTIRAGGVRCARWVAAAPATRPGTVRVASCEAGRCGPMLEWRVWETHGPLSGAGEHEHKWPAWATWTLVGVGVGAATFAGLVLAGTFRSSTETRFVNGGIKPQGLVVPF